MALGIGQQARRRQEQHRNQPGEFLFHTYCDAKRLECDGLDVALVFRRMLKLRRVVALHTLRAKRDFNNSHRVHRRNKVSVGLCALRVLRG